MARYAQFDYNGDYDTERVLITKGSATLTPDDGSDVVKIGAGDSVYFHKGFACMWHVTKPMAKHYAYVRRRPRQTAQLHHTLVPAAHTHLSRTPHTPAHTHLTLPPRAQYGADGEEMREDDGAEEWSEGISCDACKADCFAESYLCGEEDICPACYRKPESAYPADAEHQREGVAMPVNEKAASEGEEDGGGKKAKQ